MNTTNPTNAIYNGLDKAYSYFNERLFNSELPQALITMQRKKNSLGYFASKRFESKTDETAIAHEIALNPATFKTRTDKDILSTLVHEMCHLWQQENGKPSKKAYHNTEWSEKMLTVGLIPSHDGTITGKRTGQSMTHYIEEFGLFDRLASEYLKDNELSLYQDIALDGAAAKKAKKKNKVKYTCPLCNSNAWAKPRMMLICACADNLKTFITMTPEQDEDESEDEDE